MSTIPGLPEIPDDPMTVAIRKKVGDDDNAHSLLLHALTHKFLLQRIKPPKRGWSRWASLPDLYIPNETYAEIIAHLKAIGVVELGRKGCEITAIRLSATGEAWARREGLLPGQPKLNGSEQT